MKTYTAHTSSLGRLLGLALMVPTLCMAQDNLQASFDRDMNRTPPRDSRAPVNMALWTGENAPYSAAGYRSYTGQGGGDQIAASFERDTNRATTRGSRAPVNMALWTGENAPYSVAGYRSYTGQGSGDQIAASFERDMNRIPTRDSVVTVESGPDPLHELVNMALWSKEDTLYLVANELNGKNQHHGL